MDVPGDHFSLLRQSPEDMQVMVRALQDALGPFGWQKKLPAAQAAAEHAAVGDGQNLDAYLEKMGVDNSALRRYLHQTALNGPQLLALGNEPHEIDQLWTSYVCDGIITCLSQFEKDERCKPDCKHICTQQGQSLLLDDSPLQPGCAA